MNVICRVTCYETYRAKNKKIPSLLGLFEIMPSHFYLAIPKLLYNHSVL